MTLKNKDKKLFERDCIPDIFIQRKNVWIKDPDPVFSRIRVTQKDRIRPDPAPDQYPDPQH